MDTRSKHLLIGALTVGMVIGLAVGAYYHVTDNPFQGLGQTSTPDGPADSAAETLALGGEGPASDVSPPAGESQRRAGQVSERPGGAPPVSPPSGDLPALGGEAEHPHRKPDRGTEAQGSHGVTALMAMDNQRLRDRRPTRRFSAVSAATSGPARPAAPSTDSSSSTAYRPAATTCSSWPATTRSSAPAARLPPSTSSISTTTAPPAGPV